MTSCLGDVTVGVGGGGAEESTVTHPMTRIQETGTGFGKVWGTVDSAWTPGETLVEMICGNETGNETVEMIVLKSQINQE